MDLLIAKCNQKCRDAVNYFDSSEGDDSEDDAKTDN